MDGFRQRRPAEAAPARQRQRGLRCLDSEWVYVVLRMHTFSSQWARVTRVAHVFKGCDPNPLPHLLAVTRSTVASPSECVAAPVQNRLGDIPSRLWVASMVYMRHSEASFCSRSHRISSHPPSERTCGARPAPRGERSNKQTAIASIWLADGAATTSAAATGSPARKLEALDRRRDLRLDHGAHCRLPDAARLSTTANTTIANDQRACRGRSGGRPGPHRDSSPRRGEGARRPGLRG